MNLYANRPHYSTIRKNDASPQVPRRYNNARGQIRRQREAKCLSGLTPSREALMSNHTTSNGSPSSGGDPASKHSFEQLLQAAESGDVGAMEHVSECYARGEGVAQDSAQAAQWLERVAERGNAKAMVKLAHCYEIGDGVVQSQAAAVPWHLKAAEAGDADGMYWYAWCCAMGAGTTQDIGLAGTWYERAAAAGSIGAISELAHMYRVLAQVTGNPDHASRAESYYRDAASVGDGSAMIYVGLRRESGTASREDMQALFKGYVVFAESGDANYMRQVACCYMRGDGVDVDQVAATKWLLRSAQAGHHIAMTQLARRYQDGTGIKKSNSSAVEWFQRAATAGNEDAMIEMARRHSQGDGVERNTTTAADWRRKARAKQLSRWWRRLTGKKDWSWPGLLAPLPFSAQSGGAVRTFVDLNTDRNHPLE